VSEIEFKKYFEIALSEESLKNVLKRDSLKANFKVDELDSDDKKIQFEEALVDAFNEIDKYKVYHVALFDESKLSAALIDIDKKLKSKRNQIFTQPFVDRGMYELVPNLDDSEKTFGIMLFKDKIKSIRDNGGLIIREETYKILYMYRIDILKLSENKKCIIISFPTYTERKGTTHYFNEEIKYVYDMLEGYGLILHAFNVKDFFNNIPKGTDLLTQGFHGRSVSGSGENDLPIEVKYKRDSDNAFEYQDFFRMIDSNISSEIASIINSKLLINNLILKEKAEESESSILEELKNYGISESIIDEMKNYSKDGSGWLFYRQDSNQSVNIFSLIYNKVNKLQFRSTYEKWEKFKPLYEEIKKYITKS
jgi:hypothetical protein